LVSLFIALVDFGLEQIVFDIVIFGCPTYPNNNAGGYYCPNKYYCHGFSFCGEDGQALPD